MTRNPLLSFIALCLLFLCAGFPLAAEKPNIVILLCDDLGYSDLSCFAHPTIRTPHLDKLAAEGVKLTHCYSSAPVCSPSRAGLLTGRIPNRLGIRDWIPADSGIFLRPGEVTLGQLLRDAGYRTCHAGKWHLNSKTDGSERTPAEAGFDHYLYTQNNASPSHLSPTNFIRNGKPAGKLDGPSSHIVVAEAIRFLEGSAGKPFFLNLWFHEPHEPVAAAPEFLQLYPQEDNLDRRHYYGDVAQMDAAVGKLLKYLDDHKLRDNTFVFFTSDNGPETLNRYKGANRSYGSPGPLRGMKLHMTEAGFRVPGIVRWPGHTRAGTVCTAPVCNVDLLPTCCIIAGARPPKWPLDGADITPIFADRPVQRPHPLYWQYDFAINRPWVVSLRDGPWKLLANAALDRFELYNVVEDVRESKNVVDQHRERVKQLAAEMQRLHQDVKADGAKSGNPPPRQASRRPNILFILADDQRHDTIAALGNNEIQTPNLDKLVQRGFVFSNAYCQGGMVPAVCTPSRTMLLTGKSLFHIPPVGTRSYDGPMLPTAFNKAGYTTLHVGKPGNSFPPAHQAFGKNVAIPHVGAETSQKAADAVIDFLRSHKGDTPFFIYLAPSVPHDPRVAPQQFQQMYDPAKITLSKNFMPRHPFDNGELNVRDEKLAPVPRTPEVMRRHLADYYACISCLDHHVGRILDVVKETGRADNTLVVYSSDQGLAVGGRHGLMGKQNLYEHFKSPLIVAGPGIAKGQSAALVYLFDLFPTLCDLAGIATPEVAEGSSLVPVLKGKKARVREWLFAAYRDCQRMVRDERWKLIWYPKIDRYQLFDLASDPWEINDLSDQTAHATRLAELKKQLAAQQKAFGDNQAKSAEPAQERPR